MRHHHDFALGPGFARMMTAGGAGLAGSAHLFALPGLLGVGADILASQLLLGFGFDPVISHIAGFLLSTAIYYFLGSRLPSVATAVSSEPYRLRHMRFFAVCLLALFLRGGVLSLATEVWNWPPAAAMLIAITASAAVMFLGSVFYAFPSAMPASRRMRWAMAVLGIVLYAFALRFAFLGSVELIPEEAYYWNYAQHLDIGYLDHPPMVAWLIWLTTGPLGDTELGVRLGAFLCWAVTAFFSFRLTQNLYGTIAAFTAVLLVAVLPFTFGIGMLMTPDAPLTAAWSAALYFLERALLAGRRSAWWYAGICVGLGLLSKYTIALLGPATILFSLLDSRSRAWFRKSPPYFAILIAAALFAPVVVWNSRHNWASFLFQGPHRLHAPLEFSLFSMLGEILLFLTPVGLGVVVMALFRSARIWYRGRDIPMDRRSLFTAAFTLAPLSVFLVFSLFHAVKLNWTGPVFLAVLPLLAADLTARLLTARKQPGRLSRTWEPTVVILLAVYGAGLHFMALGFPGIPYSSNLRHLPVAWKEFGEEAELIGEEIESRSGIQLLRVGLDKQFLSSELAFYDRIDRDGAMTTAGRGLFGDDSLMYDYWYSASRQGGRTILIIALDAGLLSSAAIEDRFARMDPVHGRFVYKKGKRAGRFYYRVGYGYRPGSGSSGGPG